MGGWWERGAHVHLLACLPPAAFCSPCLLTPSARPCPPLPSLVQPAALRNLFENTAAVQFNHRTLAYASLAGVVSMWRYGTQLPALPRASRLVLHALAAATACQV